MGHAMRRNSHRGYCLESPVVITIEIREQYQSTASVNFWINGWPLFKTSLFNSTTHKNVTVVMSLLNNKQKKTLPVSCNRWTPQPVEYLPANKVFSIALFITMSSKKTQKKSHSQVKNTKRRTFCLCSPKRTLAVSESQWKESTFRHSFPTKWASSTAPWSAGTQRVWSMSSIWALTSTAKLQEVTLLSLSLFYRGRY